jgi:hypothetical protein
MVREGRMDEFIGDRKRLRPITLHELSGFADWWGRGSECNVMAVTEIGSALDFHLLSF